MWPMWPRVVAGCDDLGNRRASSLATCMARILALVLRPIELAPGKAASVAGDNGVVRGQMFGHPFEDVASATGPRGHEHERAAAVGLIQSRAPGTSRILICFPGLFCERLWGLLRVRGPPDGG